MEKKKNTKTITERNLTRIYEHFESLMSRNNLINLEQESAKENTTSDRINYTNILDDNIVELWGNSERDVEYM